MNVLRIHLGGLALKRAQLGKRLTITDQLRMRAYCIQHGIQVPGSVEKAAEPVVKRRVLKLGESGLRGLLNRT